ncbi:MULTISPECIES: BrnT family toxin [unclassified Aureimonas]|uniref:BrnT family toxin n=1 Tax=unclassified Aureimonas TaxID=2615206 RepID=UPI0006F99174|nr:MULTISPECIES: BrnT family toxin [unclassified Aureimonas]KQT64115.1 hypothetical protein ASG62_03680 [Aureimonas sp. Leaf427]KQT81304.1 hypothetical protein ASG54_00950 [Aureimonas sp. Leaf460]
MDGQRFDWDPVKAESNLRRHRVSFEAVRSFDFEAAMIVADDRDDYGELRWQATGPIGLRVHVLVYTMRGDTLRVISLRKANDREIRTHERYVLNEP